MRRDEAEKKLCPILPRYPTNCKTINCMAWEKTGHNPDKTVEFGYCKLIDKPATNKNEEYYYG